MAVWDEVVGWADAGSFWPKGGEPKCTVCGGRAYPPSSRSVDSLGEMRLVALLEDMIEEQGNQQAAETLLSHN